MGNFIIAIFVNLVAVRIPVVNYSSVMALIHLFLGRSFEVKLLYLTDQFFG